MKVFDGVKPATLKGFDFSLVLECLGFPTFIIVSWSYIRCFSLLKSMNELINPNFSLIFSLIKLLPSTYSLMCVNVFCITPAFFFHADFEVL